MAGAGAQSHTQCALPSDPRPPARGTCVSGRRLSCTKEARAPGAVLLGSWGDIRAVRSTQELSGRWTWVFGGLHCPWHVFQPPLGPWLLPPAHRHPRKRRARLKQATGSGSFVRGFRRAEGCPCSFNTCVDPILRVRRSQADAGNMQKTGRSGLHSGRNGDGRP